MERNSFPSVERLIPHRGGLKLIDRILSADEKTLVATTRVTDAWPLLTEGRISPVMALEVIAQAVAAWDGFQKGAKPEPSIGLLVGVKDAVFFTEGLEVGTDLTVAVTSISVIQSYGVFEGNLFAGSELICRAVVQVFTPEEDVLDARS